MNEKKYLLSTDWFRKDDISTHMDFDTNLEHHFLEIGTYEGRSTLWFVDNILLHKKSTITCIDVWGNNTKTVFLENVEINGHIEKFIILEGNSSDILPILRVENKKYDFIYIDGDHCAESVISDAILSWELLKINGLMIFDDYLLENNKEIILDKFPKEAIDIFINIYNKKLKVIFSDYIKIIRKIA